MLSLSPPPPLQPPLSPMPSPMHGSCLTPRKLMTPSNSPCLTARNDESCPIQSKIETEFVVNRNQTERNQQLSCPLNLAQFQCLGCLPPMYLHCHPPHQQIIPRDSGNFQLSTFINPLGMLITDCNTVTYQVLLLLSKYNGDLFKDKQGFCSIQS